MKVLFLGMYYFTDARVWSLERAFRAVDIEVEHCHIEKQSLKRLKPWRELYRCLKKHKGSYDFILVPYPGDRIMPFAWAFGRKSIIYDSWISSYDTQVFDRANVSQHGLRAWYFWLRDLLALRLADAMITDTKEHRQYFIDTFRVDPSRIHHIRFGANRDIFIPHRFESKENGFIVSFHGRIVAGIPGIEYILDAAELLKGENITIRFIGGGVKEKFYKEEAKRRGLTKVEFAGWVDYDDLPAKVAESDVVLGGFGTTPKAHRIVFTKVFEGAALGKPLIVGDVPPAREIFQDKINCVFVRMGDPKDLADKILLLKNDPVLRARIAEGALKLYDGPLSHRAIGESLKKILESF